LIEEEGARGKVGRPRKRTGGVQLHVDVPAELHSALLEEASRSKLNLSDLVRQALRDRVEHGAKARNDEAFERQVLRELRQMRRVMEEGTFATQVAAETSAAHFQHVLASSPEPQSEQEKRQHLERGERRWNGAIEAIREMLAAPGGEYLSQFARAQPMRGDDFPEVPAEVLEKLRGSAC
jgi:hypothetical protein